MVPVWGIVAVVFGIVGVIFGALVGVLLASLYYRDRMARAEIACQGPVKDPEPASAPVVVAQEPEFGSPGIPDDLKRISGIGAVFARRLNMAGITTFAQLAAMTAEEVAAAVDIEVAPDRILADDWIGQAAELAKGV